MKVRDLIQTLKRLDPYATVVVQEYNGSDDEPRPVIMARQVSPKYVNSLRKADSLKGKFVLISGFKFDE